MLARILSQLEEGVIALLLVSMTLLVFAEVIMRFGFNTGVLWMEELTLHVSAWLILFGASYGVKVHAHIGVDAVVKLLDPAVKRVVGAIAVLLSLLYCGLFMYGGWIYLQKLIQIGIELEDLPIPKYAAHSIIFFGFGLLGVRLLELLWQIFKGKASGFEMPDEASEALEEVRRGGLGGADKP